MTIIHHGLRSGHGYFEGNKDSLKWLNDIPHYAYVCSAKITAGGKKCIFWLVRRFYTTEKIVKGIKRLGSDINPSHKVQMKALSLLKFVWWMFQINRCMCSWLWLVIIFFCEEMIIYERSLQGQHFLTVKPVTLTCRFFNTGKSSGQAALRFLHNTTSQHNCCGV